MSPRRSGRGLWSSTSGGSAYAWPFVGGIERRAHGGPAGHDALLGGGWASGAGRQVDKLAREAVVVDSTAEIAVQSTGTPPSIRLCTVVSAHSRRSDTRTNLGELVRLPAAETWPPTSPAGRPPTSLARLRPPPSSPRLRTTTVVVETPHGPARPPGLPWSPTAAPRIGAARPPGRPLTCARGWRIFRLRQYGGRQSLKWAALTVGSTFRPLRSRHEGREVGEGSRGAPVRHGRGPGFVSGFSFVRMAGASATYSIGGRGNQRQKSPRQRPDPDQPGASHPGRRRADRNRVHRRSP